MRKHLLFLVLSLGVLIAFGTDGASAQVRGQFKATIPFDFHAGDAKFPSGDYVIHPIDMYGTAIMEISSADGRYAALFLIMDAKAKLTPKKTELFFNRYGEQYFLSKMFFENDPSGGEVLKSNYEKILQKGDIEEDARRVPGHRLPVPPK